MQNRQREGSGLASAGLGDADHVLAGQRDRDGLGLDGGWGDVVFFLEGTPDWLGEAEVLKRGQNGSFCVQTIPAAGGMRRALVNGRPRVRGVDFG